MATKIMEIFKWLSDNQKKGNIENCHLTMRTNESVNIQLGSSHIVRSNCETLLGVKIDYSHNFG